MEGADTTAENLMLDLRKAGKIFPVKALKRIGISLLHMHEHNLVHCDFGTHNIGKFGSRWKLLGVGGSVPIGKPSNPNRGFYHPPESIVVENKRAALGKKAITAVVVSIPARPSYDVWAYGVVLYEAIAGVPLSAYACRGKRAMTSLEVGKIGQWDEHNLRKALRHLPPHVDEYGVSLIKQLLHYDPDERFTDMRQVLEHPFFSAGRPAVTRQAVPEKARQTYNVNPVHSTKLPTTKEMGIPQASATQSLSSSSNPSVDSGSRSKMSGMRSNPLDYVDENSINGTQSRSIKSHEPSDHLSESSSVSKKSRKFGSIRNPFKGKKQSVKK